MGLCFFRSKEVKVCSMLAKFSSLFLNSVNVGPPANEESLG